MTDSFEDKGDIVQIEDIDSKPEPFTPSKNNPAENTDDDDPVPEGGWGWMIVVSVFLMLATLFGNVFSLAVFFVEWMRYFDASATEISWVVSLGPAIGGLTSPFAGALCTKFGSRRVAVLGSMVTFFGSFLSVFSKTVTHLYITLGLMTGIGGGLIFTPTLVMLSHYFVKRYVLANSIAFCGYSFAQMVIPRLNQFLIQQYGWRGALLIHSSFMAHMFVCTALLRPRVTQKLSSQMKQDLHHDKADKVELNSISRDISTSTTSLHLFDSMWIPTTSTTELYQEGYHSKTHKQNEDKKRSPLTILHSSFIGFISFLTETYGLSALGKSVLYVVTLVCSFAAGVGWFVTNGHLVARTVTAGISSQNDAAFLITIIGIGGFVGRAGHGILIDKGIISREVMFIASFAATGLLSFANPFLETFALLCVFAVLFGISHGIANSLVYAMMRLQVANSEAAAALSFGTLVLAVSTTVGGVLAGVLYDLTENYDVSFYFAGTMILSGTLVLSLVFIINHRKKVEVNTPQNTNVSRTKAK